MTREQDKIEREGDNGIVFNGRTNDVDGFDFRVDDDVDALRFVLHIDGRPTPMLVEVGQNNHKRERCRCSCG